MANIYGQQIKRIIDCISADPACEFKGVQMELCCFSFSSALALSFSSALQWGCCRGGSAGVGGKGEGG